MHTACSLWATEDDVAVGPPPWRLADRVGAGRREWARVQCSAGSPPLSSLEVWRCRESLACVDPSTLAALVEGALDEAEAALRSAG